MQHVKIIKTYVTPNKNSTVFYSDEMSINEAIIISEDLMKTGRIRNIDIVDRQGKHWKIKELKKYLASLEEEPHHLKVYFDGNYDREIQIAGLGCVIYYEQNGQTKRIRKNALIEEITSNNEAEYAALHFAVKELAGLGVHHLPVQFFGDSLTVINQMKGEWACYEKELNEWADRIDLELEELGIEPEYEVVKRAQNKEADQLATQALNKIEIISTNAIDA